MVQGLTTALNRRVNLMVYGDNSPQQEVNLMVYRDNSPQQEGKSNGVR